MNFADRFSHGVGPEPRSWTREPDGAEIAAAVLSDLMADWSPDARADALDALALDLAEGGSIEVGFWDEEDRR